MANIPEKHELRLREAGMHVEAFSDELKSQLAKLSPEEINSLVAIKAKLNADLPAAIRKAADTIGGFVW
jgi:hypothetical protein